MGQKLSQIVAVEKSTKQRTNDTLTETNKTFLKADLFEGFQRIYDPVREDGERLPPETKVIQKHAEALMTDAMTALKELFEVSATRDWANCAARADILIGSEPLLKDVPATFLLFLEKQLNDLHTLVGNLPTLDPSETWTKDENADLFKAPARQTTKTKKVAKPLVLHPPTKEHPAQTQLIQDDEIVGHWSSVRVSGAVPLPRKKRLIERIEILQRAVKFAREEANTSAAPDISTKALIDWIMR